MPGLKGMNNNDHEFRTVCQNLATVKNNPLAYLKDYEGFNQCLVWTRNHSRAVGYYYSVI